MMQFGSANRQEFKHDLFRSKSKLWPSTGSLVLTGVCSPHKRHPFSPRCPSRDKQRDCFLHLCGGMAIHSRINNAYSYPPTLRPAFGSSRRKVHRRAVVEQGVARRPAAVHFPIGHRGTGTLTSCGAVGTISARESVSTFPPCTHASEHLGVGGVLARNLVGSTDRLRIRSRFIDRRLRRGCRHHSHIPAGRISYIYSIPYPF